MKINNLGGVIFDLDGTLYLGDAALPEAAQVCSELRRQGKQLIFVSNKPLAGREAYAAKLTRLGIPATPDEVITSAHVLSLYLKQTAPALRLYVIGEENTRAELSSHGLIVLDERLDQDPREVIDPRGIDAVVVAFDRTLDYRKLNTAYQALMQGAHFYATNADKTCPMPGGAIPDAGATIQALETITGRKVEWIAGKPSGLILKYACETLELPAERCMMVGDRIETDIRMGVEAGMHTALVLTGVTRREQIEESSVRPEFILETLADLMNVV